MLADNKRRGRIKFFSRSRGYGHIELLGGGKEDIFFYIPTCSRQLRLYLLKTLNPSGKRVAFILAPTLERQTATKVRNINPSSMK